MDEVVDDDVLIVGAGPTGLLLGLALARLGVKARIIDKRAAPSRYSKALALHARSLEILDNLDVAEPFLEAGQRIYGLTAWGDEGKLTHIEVGGHGGTATTRFPFILSLPQSETERLLIEALAEEGLTVERRTELVAVSQSNDRVEATVHHSDGRVDASTCRYLIGCDGASSMVRRELKIPFEGEQRPSWWALGDCVVASQVDTQDVHAVVGPGGVMLLLPMPGGLTRVIAPMLDQTDEERPDLSYEELEELIRERSPWDVKMSDPQWVSTFRITRAMVPTYRSRRVFLAGDAAHVHSPIGGQGMNTGLQDAFNLAWKLHLTLGGHASDAVLESYDAERRPVAQQLLSMTRRATSMVATRRKLAAALRPHMIKMLEGFELLQDELTQRATMLKVNYLDSPIVGEHHPGVGDLKLTSGRDDERPSVRQALGFARAPSAGERCPDVLVGDAWLHHLLAHDRHSLLLLDGEADTAQGYASMRRIAADVRAGYDSMIEVLHVVPRVEVPDALDDQDKVILDTEHAIHDILGGWAECLYLIRPDGYIGYRSQPADGERLMRYLNHLYR